MCDFQGLKGRRKECKLKMNKQNTNNIQEFQKIYELIKTEEKIKEKKYREWTKYEKLEFIFRNNVNELVSLLNNNIKNLDKAMENQQILPNKTLREEDITNLIKLGFILAYEQEEKKTDYDNFCDINGVPIYRKEKTKYALCKDTHFIKTKKSIYISIEHIFNYGGYNTRTDVSGYMIVKQKNCIEDIKKNIFWDWSIEIINDEDFGIPIYTTNFEESLKYLKEEKVNDFKNFLPAYHLPLKIEEYENGIMYDNYYGDNKRKYVDKLLSMMSEKMHNYFDNTLPVNH